MSKREYERGTLGWWMDDQRGELGLTWEEVAERAGVTPETLRRNAGNPSGVRTTTRKGIERALNWDRGSVDNILRGGEPTLVEPEPTEDQVPSREELLEITRDLAERAAKLERLLGRMSERA